MDREKIINHKTIEDDFVINKITKNGDTLDTEITLTGELLQIYLENMSNRYSEEEIKEMIEKETIKEGIK